MLVIVPAVAVKVAVVAPAVTVTEAGTVNKGLLLDSGTATPPEGAAPEKVTVQVELPAVPRLDWLQPRELSTTGAVSDRVAVWVLLLYVAVTVADPSLLIVPAVAVKVAVVAPAATATEAGTVSNPLLLDSVMLAPPAGAAEDTVTVHVELLPVARAVGLHPIELIKIGGVNETTAVCVLLLYVAVMVADPLVVIVPAVAVNVALVAPAGTVTDAGTVISALLLESVTTMPPVGAACLRVTVQVEDPPVASDVGLQFRLLMPTGTLTVILPPVAPDAMLVPVDDAA